MTEEERREYYRAWKRANKEHVIEYNRSWRNNHMEKVREYSRAYRKRQAIANWAKIAAGEQNQSEA